MTWGDRDQADALVRVLRLLPDERRYDFALGVFRMHAKKSPAVVQHLSARLYVKRAAIDESAVPTRQIVDDVTVRMRAVQG